MDCGCGLWLMNDLNPSKQSQQQMNKKIFLLINLSAFQLMIWFIRVFKETAPRFFHILHHKTMSKKCVYVCLGVLFSQNDNSYHHIDRVGVVFSFIWIFVVSVPLDLIRYWLCW